MLDVTIETKRNKGSCQIISHTAGCAQVDYNYRLFIPDTSTYSTVVNWSWSEQPRAAAN